MDPMMMVVVGGKEMEEEEDAKYVEKKGYLLEVFFCCLYPLKVSLATAWQRS